MSRSTITRLDWADGHYTFALPIARLEELQEKVDAGPAEIFLRLQEGRWRVGDYRETIRIALIGGGTDPGEARSLIKNYVDDRPLAEALALARIILFNVINGAPDETVDRKSVV